MDAVDSFAARAQEFVSWAERTSPSAPSSDAFEVLNILAALYAAALTLPNGNPANEERNGTTEGEWRRVYSRCSNLPFEFYWNVFDPLQEPPEEPVCGSLADDLADIHRDLKMGLVYFEEGAREAAAWAWQFNFRVHWGDHATSALYALHRWYSQNHYPEPGGY